MDRIRLFAVGMLMMFALTAGAQQTAIASAAVEKENHAQNVTDPVEQHVKKLSEQLSLTPDQEDLVRPILREMHDSWQKAEQTQGLSDEERKAQVRAAFIKADGQIREVLTDDQKKTLDQLEEHMHGK